MKKLIIVLFIFLTISSCNSGGSTDSADSSSSNKAHYGSAIFGKDKFQ